MEHATVVRPTTSLHKFVTAPSGASTYRGSGAVPGTLLNPYAMSEYQGVLRVASTVSGRRGWTSPRSVTEGVVTTLREQDGTLRQLGQVGGLGREDNESIHAVRFIEERGYVVTFRRTDPLYVLDLRDAASPQVVGELKIPGYSGYLHPIGDQLLLGVGQSGVSSATSAPDGSEAACSSHCSTSATPRRPAGSTPRPTGAGQRPPSSTRGPSCTGNRATWSSLPRACTGPPREGAFSGLVLLHADADGLTELGRVATPEADGTATRSVVIGDLVYVLSDRALSAHGLDTHREIDRLTF